MSRELRVMQVVLSLNPGGTERLVVELARRLHPSVPMAVCCLDDAGTWAHELTSAGIAVESLHRPSGFVPTLAGKVAATAARHGATVLHCHHYSPFVYGGLARLWSPRLRVIYTEHGRLSDSLPSQKRRLANAVIGRFPGAVFAVSAELRQHLIAEGFSSSQADVIYNGIELGPLPSNRDRVDVRQQLGVPADAFVVGTVARLDPVKDLGTLIDAVALLRDANVCLVVVGDGPEAGALRQRATSAGVAAQIKFLGHRNDARRWLAGCDAYANSSISEGVSLTILEAMAAGLPVVATRVGGTPEVVDDESGRLVPARNAASLANALDAFRSDLRLRQQVGGAARRRAESHFTIERMVADYRRVYERLA